MGPVLRGLDPRQYEAVTIDASPLAIVAAAGSGKTTVLTRRIARRVLDGSADARHVLAVTFTRDAAGELRRRLRRLDIREAVEAGTFHSVALRLLRDRAVATGAPLPSVASDRGRLVREALTQTRLRCEPSAALADLDWARARLVPAERFAEANRAVRRRPALPGDAFAPLSQAYEAIKRRRGVVDFDDLLADLLALMRRDDTFAAAVRWRFRHLFVDEAQDLNPLQHALLEEIQAGRPDICLVGDHRQAIYGWNGADPTTLLEVERVYPGVTVVSLIGNHRCSPQIVRAGAAALAAARIADDTESRRPEGGSLTVVAAQDDHDEAQRVAATVRDLARRHGRGHVAVLARTNEQLDALGRAMQAVGVPVARAAGTTALERAVAEAARCRTRDELARWADAVWAADQVSPVRSRVAEEVDRFLTADEPGGFRAWVEARQPFDDLERLDEGAGASSGAATGRPSTDDGAVSLLTFHAAKGREWEAVVVTGVEDGLVPHASATTAAQRAEEARLLYVALTRASDTLVLTWAARRRDAVSGPSPWLDAVAATIEVPHHVAPPVALRRPQRPADPLDALRGWRAGVARAAGVAPTAVCSDQVLRGLLADPPAGAAEIGRRLGLGTAAAERLAPRLLEVLATAGPPG